MNDTVVSLLPNWDTECYAPGIVVKVSNSQNLVVRFYDGQETAVKQAFRIPIFKFDYDVRNIIELEKLWLGLGVIAFNPITCRHEIGKLASLIVFLFFFAFISFNMQKRHGN